MKTIKCIYCQKEVTEWISKSRVGKFCSEECIRKDSEDRHNKWKEKQKEYNRKYQENKRSK